MTRLGERNGDFCCVLFQVCFPCDLAMISWPVVALRLTTCLFYLGFHGCFSAPSQCKAAVTVELGKSQEQHEPKLRTPSKVLEPHAWSKFAFISV